MDKNELILKLIEISLDQVKRDDGNFEKDHYEADALLLQYINDPMVTKAFHEIEKWYS